MVNIREKGKISHSEWAEIMARHKRGETLASIARSYGCTAPAIRYIVTRQMTDRTSETGRDSAARQPEDQPARERSPSQNRHVPTSESAKSALPAIDRDLRERVNSDVARFLVAFDTAFDHDTAESRVALREATDRLLRICAKTRMAVEMNVDDEAGTDAVLRTDRSRVNARS
jgi:hypothetical protein